MKKLIAESGSTKTVWVLLDNKVEIWRTKSVGLNPHVVDREQVHASLRSKRELSDLQYEPIDIHFYGAGCSTLAMRELVASMLVGFFKKAQVEVQSDLLAAARALCAHEPGLVGIFGTGTNLAFYDGKNLDVRNVSLGYLLGDELSGNWIGKHLLHDHLYNILPEPFESEMSAKLGADKPAIVDKMYAAEFPNRFLAALAPIAMSHKEHSYVQALLLKGFDEWKRFHLGTYPERAQYPIHFVGSIAMELKKFLTKSLKEEGLKVGSFDNKPINALLAFHSKS